MTTEPVINFLPYQKKWINDDSRFKIGMITRRGGKTYGSAGEIVDDCVQAEIAKRKVRWTILSRSEKTAMEALSDAVIPMTKAYYEIYKTLRNSGSIEIEEDVFTAPAYERQVVSASGRVFTEQVPEAKYKTMEVKFPGGSRVVALSASPGAARGFGGNLLLDEFAFHADSRLIWGAAMPVAARGGHKVRVISTPNGKGNKFYEVMSTDDPIWSKHHVDIYDAVKQGLDVDIDELRRAIADEDIWGQEFELKWMDAASAWLDYDLIAGCENPNAGKPSLYKAGQCFVGMDIAARNDLFVIWVLELLSNGQLITREVIAEKRISFREQDRLLDGVMKRYRVVGLAIDQTGMGEKPVEDAKRRYGEDRVQGVLFSNASKLELATGLKESMQDRRVLIPGGDPILRADLHAIRSTTGPTGIRRLVSDGETDGHADRFWAASLAVAASHTEYQPYAYRPVTHDELRNMDGQSVFITAGFGRIKGVF